MLYPQEVLLIVKLSDYPITAKNIARKLKLKRNQVSASLYSAMLEDPKLTVMFRNPENSMKKKRPIWSYKKQLL